ncbi:uncharacterized protein [Typha latifolia]|uniref:uncharacterized protein n=1 Tax=Typha latifolia TaxID=4733 RepID=UPI003C2B0CA6
MAAELDSPAATTQMSPRKRKLKPRKGKKPFKKAKKPLSMDSATKAKKPTQRMLKIFQKRAKNYHSDDEEAEELGEEEDDDASSGDEERQIDSDREGSEGDDEGEGGGGHRGITRFTEGCRTFRVAFLKIMKKNLPNDPLGPILSANKKLVAEKLAEEETEHKVKGEAKKEKLLAAEKGHAKPANFLDAKEKFLISVATKGVVRLFNAVSKGQNPQRGLNPSKLKDAKVLAKQRKETFLSELKKSTTQGYSSHLSSSSSKLPSLDKEDTDEPGWAPLRDSYMLTNSNSKLKDWDKLPDPVETVDEDEVPMGSSSDED